MESGKISCPVDGCTSVFTGEHGKAIHVSRSHPSYKKQQLLEAIHRTSDIVGSTPTKDEFHEHTEQTEHSIKTHFGSWNNAIRAAGLEPHRQNPDGKDELLSLIRKLAERVGHTPTYSEFTDADWIPYTAVVVTERFCSWNDALREAGFEPNYDVQGRAKSESYTEEDVINAIDDVAQEVGGVPTTADFTEHAQFSFGVATYKFDSWNDALRAAGYEPTHLWGIHNGHRKYGYNWKTQRESVIDRDGKQCRVCNEHISSLSVGSMHVHHITPARTFGADDDNVDTDYEAMNALDNLISLCASCHSQLEGKFQDASPAEFAEKGRAELGYDNVGDEPATAHGDTVVVEEVTTLDRF